MTLSRCIAVLFPLRAHLENELKQQREDFQERLAEKNVTIRQLRVELAAAKSDSSQTAQLLTDIPIPFPRQEVQFDLPQDWQSDLSRLLKEEENGIRSRGRIQEHEPSADDVA